MPAFDNEIFLRELMAIIFSAIGATVIAAYLLRQKCSIKRRTPSVAVDYVNASSRVLNTVTAGTRCGENRDGGFSTRIGRACRRLRLRCKVTRF